MGYGKIFDTMFHGSMSGAGCHVFAVWAYVIAKVFDGVVEVHPVGVSRALGCTVSDVEKAIKYLTKPDPYSRRKDHEGRRLIHLSEYLYEVPSAEYYRGLIRDKDRKDKAREKKRRQRGTTGGQSPSGPPIHKAYSILHTAKDIKKQGEFVEMTQEQLRKLIDKLGLAKTNDLIDRLNNYIGSKGKEYKSHYHTILIWHARDEKDKAGAGQSTQKPRLYPISGKTCYKDKCSLPAVYKSKGSYDNYFCWKHSPQSVREAYSE